MRSPVPPISYFGERGPSHDLFLHGTYRIIIQPHIDCATYEGSYINDFFNCPDLLPEEFFNCPNFLPGEFFNCHDVVFPEFSEDAGLCPYIHGDHFTFYSETDAPWNTQSHTTDASVVETPSSTPSLHYSSYPSFTPTTSDLGIPVFTRPEPTIIPQADSNSDQFEGCDTIGGVGAPRTSFYFQRSHTAIRKGPHATEPLRTNTTAIHPAERRLCCNDCSSSFLDRRQLKNHMRNQHTRYPCTEVGCKAEYRHRKSLWQHQKEKHELKKYVCDRCAYFSGRVGNLKRHKAKKHVAEG